MKMLVDDNTRDWLTRRYGDKVRYQEPMARHTYIGVGGPAEAYLRPGTAAELTAAVKYALGKGLPYLIIGGGTNLLVKDGGLSGLVICLTDCLQGIYRTATEGGSVSVTVLAGTMMVSLCRYAVDNGLGGLNFAQGIPGTVGGGIKMNAGTGEGQMGSVLTGISVLLPTSGETLAIERQHLAFGYRSLSLGDGLGEDETGPIIILGGRLDLNESDPRALREEAQAVLRDRKRKQPLNQPSAGCFFKNPACGKPAGELIDLAGLKGERVGGAAVSVKHGNFLVNAGGASAGDFLALMERVQQKVSAEFGIDLEPEVAIVGT